MFFINELKRIVNNQIIIIFLIISYFLIFKNSKELKRKNFHKDYKIVKVIGILYGILAVAAGILINI